MAESQSTGIAMAQTRSSESSAKSWFVYILRCADGSLYTGISNDVSRRLAQHNAGKASRYTRSRIPVELVYQEPQDSRSLALKRELAIKALSRSQKETLVRAWYSQNDAAWAPEELHR